MIEFLFPWEDSLLRRYKDIKKPVTVFSFYMVLFVAFFSATVIWGIDIVIERGSHFYVFAIAPILKCITALVLAALYRRNVIISIIARDYLYLLLAITFFFSSSPMMHKGLPL